MTALMERRRSLGGALGILALTLSATAFGEAPPDPRYAAAPLAFRPGIVVTAERKVAYVMRPGGGIEAVDLASGRPLWQSRHADKPLLLADHRLLAQADDAGTSVLHLVVLDPATGRKIAAADARMPAGVRVAIDEGLDSSFATTAEDAGRDAVVSWRLSERRLAGGLGPGGEHPTLREASGRLRVDLASARSRPVESEGAAVPPASLPGEIGRLVSAGALSRPPLRSGTVLAATARGTGDAADCVVLRRWDARTGAALPDARLFCGAFLVQAGSVDGRQLLVVSREEGGAPDAYTWSLYAVESGERIAHLPSASSAAPFVVVASRLVQQAEPSGRLADGRWVSEPLRLRAVDLQSGAEAWTCPVRDTAYNGPYPAR